MKKTEFLNQNKVVTVLPRSDRRIFGLEIDKIGVPHGFSLQTTAREPFAIMSEAQASKNVEQKSVTSLPHSEVL